MGEQRSLLDAPARVDATEVLADLEVDYTPVACALAWALSLACSEGWTTVLDRETDRVWLPRRILDVGAGSGVWGRVCRCLWPDAVLTAVEARESEASGLVRVYDEVFAGCTLSDYLDRVVPAEPFDLVIGNPPFSAFGSTGRPWWELIGEAGIAKGHAPLAFVGLSQWGQSATAIERLQRHAPYDQHRLGGRPAFRADGKTDSRDYSLWVFAAARQQQRPVWGTCQIGTLPAALRRWSPAAVPGTYEIDEALLLQVAEIVVPDTAAEYQARRRTS